MLIAAAAAATALVIADRPLEVVGTPANQAAYKARLHAEAVKAESAFSLSPPCPEAAISAAAPRVRDAGARPEGYQDKAAYESVAVRGCGRTMRVNLSLTPRNDYGDWFVVRQLPGESPADPGAQTRALIEVLQLIRSNTSAQCSTLLGESMSMGDIVIENPKGGVQFVLQGRRARPPRNPRLGDTVITVRDAALLRQLSSAQAWRERWPLTACGEDRTVLVLFAPIRSQPGAFVTWAAPAWRAGANP